MVGWQATSDQRSSVTSLHKSCSSINICILLRCHHDQVILIRYLVVGVLAEAWRLRCDICDGLGPTGIEQHSICPPKCMHLASSQINIKRSFPADSMKLRVKFKKSEVFEDFAWVEHHFGRPIKQVMNRCPWVLPVGWSVIVYTSCQAPNDILQIF